MRRIQYFIEDIGYFFYDLWEDRPWVYSVVGAILLFIYYEYKF